MKRADSRETKPAMYFSKGRARLLVQPSLGPLLVMALSVSRVAVVAVSPGSGLVFCGDWRWDK